jgi:hypothetical protein
MENTKKAIEISATINDRQQLVLDDPLPIKGPARVRVIILMPEIDDIDENQWLRSVKTNPAFDFLCDPAEDIYPTVDGRPFNDK